MDGVDDVVGGAGASLFDSTCGASGPVCVVDSGVGEDISVGFDHAVLAVVVSGVVGFEFGEDL